MKIFSALVKGIAAGAAGTSALNAVTYLDMAVRARPPSPLPQAGVSALAERVGRPVPGQGEELDNRLEGLGALSGLGTGVGIGVLTEAVAPVLVRLPVWLASLLVGGGAMLATNLPMTRLGLTSPKAWSAADWTSDVVPHLAYGLATVTVHRVVSAR